MKDNFSLIAAAAGGFMLSVALSGILKGAPVTNLAGSHVNYYLNTKFQTVAVRKVDNKKYIIKEQNE